MINMQKTEPVLQHSVFEYNNARYPSQKIIRAFGESKADSVMFLGSGNEFNKQEALMNVSGKK
jgi:hypothetical protein